MQGDGLLVNHIASAEKIDYKDAEVKVKDFVRECEERLKNNERVRLAKIGSFHYDKERNLQFLPDSTENFLLSTFGMPKVSYQPVALKKEPIKPVAKTTPPPEVAEIKKNKPIKVEPKEVAIKQELKPKEKIKEKKTARKKKRRISFASVSFTMIALLLASGLSYQVYNTDKDLGDLFSIPKLGEIKMNYSNILDSVFAIGSKDDVDEEVLEKRVFINEEEESGEWQTEQESTTVEEEENIPESNDQAYPGNEVMTENETMAAGITFEEVTLEDDPAEDFGPKIEKTPVAPVEPASTPSNAERHNYYIIVGSFKAEYRAQRLVDKLEARGIYTNIIRARMGNYRVGIGYGSRSEANTNLSKYRSEITSQSWILRNI